MGWNQKYQFFIIRFNSSKSESYIKINSTGTGATATGTDAIAIGASAATSKDNAIAIGAGASTYAIDSVAFGHSAIVGLADNPSHQNYVDKVIFKNKVQLYIDMVYSNFVLFNVLNAKLKLFLPANILITT